MKCSIRGKKIVVEKEGCYFGLTPAQAEELIEMLRRYVTAQSDPARNK
jgi:hypothetical protein